MKKKVIQEIWSFYKTWMVFCPRVESCSTKDFVSALKAIRKIPGFHVRFQRYKKINLTKKKSKNSLFSCLFSLLFSIALPFVFRYALTKKKFLRTGIIYIIDWLFLMVCPPRVITHCKYSRSTLTSSWLSRLGLQRGMTSPTIVLDMTLSYLMVRFQYWNRIVLTSEQRTLAKMNCLK